MSITWKASWMDDENPLKIHEGKVTLRDDGSVGMTDHRIREENERISRAPGREKRSPAPPIVKWMGLKWIGIPAPYRMAVRIWTAREVREASGCGCVLFLKVSWEGIRRAWARSRDARSVSLEDAMKGKRSGGCHDDCG